MPGPYDRCRKSPVAAEHARPILRNSKNLSQTSRVLGSKSLLRVCGEARQKAAGPRIRRVALRYTHCNRHECLFYFGEFYESARYCAHYCFPVPAGFFFRCSIGAIGVTIDLFPGIMDLVTVRRVEIAWIRIGNVVPMRPLGGDQ